MRPGISSTSLKVSDTHWAVLTSLNSQRSILAGRRRTGRHPRGLTSDPGASRPVVRCKATGVEGLLAAG